ncbi:MAG: hypothetical protein KDI88_13545 [Gammaproteobacteria bacterium]|nr:hypothetical protein [Gammaproteobacteria bacterium]
MNDNPSPADSIRNGLLVPKFEALRLDRLLSGSDSTVIDVAFGPGLREMATAYAVALVRDGVQRLWDSRSPASDAAVGDEFARELKAHHRQAIKLAKSSGRIERLQAFQLAIIKLVLIETDAEIEAVREELGEARNQPATQSSGQGLKLHNRAVLLARRVSSVRYGIARQLTSELLRLEYADLMPLRKSVLGNPWPIAEAMLNNPVLQLGGVGMIGDFAANYPICVLDQESMRRVNRCLVETFAEWLPPAVATAEVSKQPPRIERGGRRGQGAIRGLLETERRVRLLCGSAELSEGVDSWLDEPDNAATLLGSDAFERSKIKRWFAPGIADLQHRHWRRFDRNLGREDLKDAITASYEFDEIYPVLGLVGAESVVFDFLRGSIGRRDAIRRLDGIDGVRDADGLVRRIASRRRELQRKPVLGKTQLLARFARDFMRLRRDMKLGWRALVAMDMIRLVERDAGPVSSDDGAPLLIFHGNAPVETAREDVIGHVVVRVEVQGMLALVTQMHRLRLDPTAKLSGMFFDRVTKCVERFGAQKVSVDSEAMVFSLMQRDGHLVEHLAVARACALARAVVELTTQMNVRNAELSLPEIEVAVAISYCDEPPVFVYDNVRKVTVSSALRRVRQLTRNHPVLRKSYPLPGGRGLRVVMPVKQDGSGHEEHEPLARANVNAIELDTSAFSQLQREIRLRCLEMREKERGRQMVVHVGECTDVRGETVGVFVRQRSIRFWMGRQLIDSRDPGRLYYEVLWEPKILEVVHGYLHGSERQVGAD